jgi:hypothetical protein
MEKSWHAQTINEKGLLTCCIRAQTWFEAREKACVRLQADKEEIIVVEITPPPPVAR